MTELDPRITDEEVGRLPLSHGRSELLEEIMRTEETDPTLPLSPRHRAGWWTAAAAAAVVAGITLVPALHHTAEPGPDGGGAGPAGQEPAASQQPVRSVASGRYYALTAAGWRIDDAFTDETSYEISWVKGEDSFETDGYTADQYDSYFHDRDDEMAGTTSTLFGQRATTWAYDEHDHATMRTPEDGWFVEFRGTGMDLAAYRQLLDSVVQTDEDGLAQSIGGDVVTPSEAPAEIHRLLQGAQTPAGFEESTVRLTGFNTAYQAAAQVAGAVGCAWLEVYQQGGTEAQERAIAAFDGSRDWPLFDQMVGEGDYPEVFWAVADQLRSGTDAPSIGMGIGSCGAQALARDPGAGSSAGDSPKAPTANPTAG